MLKSSLKFLLIFTITTTLAARDYDLPSILALAKKNNKEIKLANSDLSFASAQMKEAISTALPKINLDLQYNRNFMQNVFYFTVKDSTGKSITQSFKASFSNEYQMNAVLSQTIYGFGKIGNAIKAAKYFKTFTNYQYQNQLNGIYSRVKKSFFQALLLKKIWAVSKESERSAKENYENTRIKYQSGVTSEFDLLQAEVRWKNAIPETITARKNYELAENNLKILVEIPLEEEMNLIGDFEIYPMAADTINQKEIFGERPDYNALLWEKQLRERKVAAERSNHYPTLNGSLAYTYSARSDLFRLDNSNDNIILGLTLSVPIFSGGFTSAQVQKAKIDVQRVNTQIQMAQDNIRIELKNIQLRIRESKERISAAKKSVSSAERAFQIAESRAKNGLATQLELKDSRIFLDRAKISYFSAIYDYLNAYFDWEVATGRVSSEDI